MVNKMLQSLLHMPQKRKVDINTSQLMRLKSRVKLVQKFFVKVTVNVFSCFCKSCEATYWEQEKLMGAISKNLKVQKDQRI